MREEIECLVGPRQWGDTRESWLSRVPKVVKSLLGTQSETVSFRTVRALWYGEISDPEHSAARDVRRAAELSRARKSALDLAGKYRQIAGDMSAADKAFFSEQVTRLELVASKLCGGDRAG